jgi:hypothetical protein
VDGVDLRLAREEVFVVFRLMPAALFFERRVFSATALRVEITPLLVTIPLEMPLKKYAPGGEHRFQGILSL